MKYPIMYQNLKNPDRDWSSPMLRYVSAPTRAKAQALLIETETSHNTHCRIYKEEK